MNCKAVAFIALALSLTSHPLQADSLRDIYELALENDAQLKAQEATYLARREVEKLNRAELLPQISTSYSYRGADSTTEGQSFIRGEELITVTDTTTEEDTDTDGYLISLNQAIFDLPAWFSFRSGKQVTKEAEATFAADQQNLILRVVEAYLEVLRAQENLAASRATERAFERQLEQTRQRFEVGLIAITDVHEAEAARDQARVNRIIDENNVSVALEMLSVLTGQRHSNLKVLEEDFKARPPTPADRAEWVNFSLENNFELQAARYREEAARQTAKANFMEHAPRITGSIEYSEFDTEGEREVTPNSDFTPSPEATREQHIWEINISLPLFTGGALSAERRRTAQEFNAARQERINLTRNTVTNTRSLHMTVLSDVSRVAARRQSIVSSESALDATQAGYDVGTRNIVDLLNAQNTLFQARRDYANSRYDYIVNMMRLQEQAGLLSPEDIYRLDSYLKPPPPPTAGGASAGTATGSQ